jgi:hypothetical protein
MMTAYADVMEEDGMIIALNQEKAYENQPWLSNWNANSL